MKLSDIVTVSIQRAHPTKYMDRDPEKFFTRFISFWSYIEIRRALYRVLCAAERHGGLAVPEDQK